MPRASKRLASAAVILFGLGASAFADTRVGGLADPPAVGRSLSFAAGSISGVVLDERGMPVPGAMVSSLGPTTASAITDASGRFEIKTLAPGPYVVRAHMAGYVSPKADVVRVQSGARASSPITLRRGTAAPRILTAGFGDLSSTPAATESASDPEATDASSVADAGDHDHSETAWRIRHLRRGVLKDVTLPQDLLGRADPGHRTPTDFLGRAAESSARLATSYFETAPFSGQVNLLTAGSFGASDDVFASNGLMRNIANVVLSAPAGSQADWTVGGGFAQADISSWNVTAAYKTRAPAIHSYALGLSYATERSAAGSPLALHDLSDGSRTAGEVYAFDTFAVTPTLSVTYGGRWARYDYLAHRSALSPRLEVALTPGHDVRLNAMISRRATAPGAEEFVTQAETGAWLPPQRTFSSFEPGAPLSAERVTHLALEAERDFGRSTVSVQVFRQRIDDQIAALFGADVPGRPRPAPGQYFVGNAGAGSASGYRAAYRRVLSDWMKGSIEYTVARGSLHPVDQSAYLLLLAPSTTRPADERMRTLATTIETNVPETSTRVLVVYRLSDAFAGTAGAGQPDAGRPRLDSRFDVEVRQSLPFMDFANARWEILVAVRNFFREVAVDQSVYDELLVVRPPKRFVGGLTMRF